MARAKLEQGKKFSWLKLLLSPPFKFIKMFLIKRGYLDGFYGFLLAVVSSYSTFMKYILMRVLEKDESTGSDKSAAKNKPNY
jgi:hypothetical protein